MMIGQSQGATGQSFLLPVFRTCPAKVSKLKKHPLGKSMLIFLLRPLM